MRGRRREGRGGVDVGRRSRWEGLVLVARGRRVDGVIKSKQELEEMVCGGLTFEIPRCERRHRSLGDRVVEQARTWWPRPECAFEVMFSSCRIVRGYPIARSSSQRRRKQRSNFS